MKYVVEIDTTSKVGEEAIAYLRALKKSSKAVHIREVEEVTFRKLTPEDLALPMNPPPTDEELEAYLKEDDEDDDSGTDGETVRKRILKKLADSRK